jgi:competence protein ComEA
VVELLRPPPRSSWRDRLATLAGGVTITRLLTTAGAVLLVAVTAWWLLRTPAPPVERSLPSARSPGAGVAASAGSTPGAPTATTVATSLVATTTATEVVVQAAGAGARVVDVVTAAGGPTADADLQAVPLAAKVTDGARVYVPRAGEVVPAGGGSSAGTDGGGAAIGVASGPGPPTPADPLDLNQATELELEALPGVGPATAQAIVDYRTEHGPFAAVDDLLDVRGIGPAKLDAFRDVVRVG